MITAYFTKTTKYLQKDDYRKDFDVSSLADLISKIKVKEPILIKASSKDIFDFKFKSGIKGEFDYEILQDFLPLTTDIATTDIQNLLQGKVNYVLYQVADKYQKMLGEQCYLVNNVHWQNYFLDKKGVMALTLNDLKNLNLKTVVKIMLNGKEIDDVQTDNQGWGNIYHT